MYAPIYRIQLVRERRQKVRSRAVPNPDAAARILFDYLKGVDRETFVVLLLSTAGRLIGVSTVSVGTLEASFAHPREVFKPAILSNAASVIVAHNHPSGDPTPSAEDRAVTQRLSQAGEILGIAVADHLILGADGRFTSLKQSGLL